MDLSQSGHLLMFYETFLYLHCGFFMREVGGDGVGESPYLSIDSPENLYPERLGTSAF